MKLIIDIPDDNYKFIKDLQSLIIGGRGNCKTIQYNVINAIKTGIPYEERPNGKWIIHNDYNENRRYGCNQCGNLTNRNSSFCPDCGADMKGEEDDTEQIE